MKMLGVLIDYDEWYPVFYVKLLSKDNRSGFRKIKVSDNTFKKWEKIQDDFTKLQKELRKRSNYK